MQNVNTVLYATIFCGFLINPVSLIAQDTLSERRGYQVVDQMPEFPGGDEKMYRYLSENLKFSKRIIENDPVYSKVYVGFIVEADGQLTNFHLKRGESGPLADEVIRVLKSMPPWNPGKMAGEPVAVEYILPVKVHPQ